MNGRTGWLRLVAGALAVLNIGAPARAVQDASARPPVDAPELARLGDWAIGVAADELVQPGQADPTKAGALADRRLALTIWYPAAAAGKGTTYHTALSGEDGVVWRDAPIGRYPGYSPGAPASTVWKGFQPSRHAGMTFEARPAQ